MSAACWSLVRPAASFTINGVVAGVAVVVGGWVESVVEEEVVLVRSVGVVSVKVEVVLDRAVVVASEEVGSVARPLVVASAEAGGGDGGFSGVVMMLPSGPTSA